MMNSAADLNQLNGPGILIEGSDRQKFTQGQSCILNIIGQFPDEGDIELNIRWLRSLFFSCVSKSNQIAMGSNLLKSSVIFPSDITVVNKDLPMIQIAYQLNLAHELNHPLSNGSYYVQASAMFYLSNMVEVIVS